MDGRKDLKEAQIEPEKRQTLKKNHREKEDDYQGSESESVKVEQKPEKYNVYTNPRTNPFRNPNVDPKRSIPLTEQENLAIVEAHEKYEEAGGWNLSIILSNEFGVHVSFMSIYRVLYPGKYRVSNDTTEENEITFYEKYRPHAMYHADTMEVILENGDKIYQISTEDDHSRGYMGLIVSKRKHSYYVIIALLQAFRLHSKPRTFHHDNGSEYKNGAVKQLLEMLNISDVPTKVRNPKGNGKKERAHRQDREYFYNKNQFEDIESVEQKIPEYFTFRNEVKGQWALYGQTSSSVFACAKRDPMTDDELEIVMQNLHFEKARRQVGRHGKVKFKGKWYHVGKDMYGQTVEMRVSLRGMEVWHDNQFLKRWKYWSGILGFDAEYILQKYLL